MEHKETTLKAKTENSLPTFPSFIGLLLQKKANFLVMFGSAEVLSKLEIFRSSRSEVFCKKGVLRNFAKFTGKDLCQSLFVNQVADQLY